MKRWMMFIFPLLLIPVWLFAQGELPPAEIPLMLSTIIGILAPILVQFVNVKVSSALYRAFIAIGLSALVGFIGALVAGVPTKLTPAYIAWVFTVGQTAFNLFWKPLFNSTLSVLKHK